MHNSAQLHSIHLMQSYVLGKQNKFQMEIKCFEQQ